MKKFVVEYGSYDVFVRLLHQRVKNLNPVGIYGLPRGGLPVAVHLSHHLDVPMFIDLDQYKGGTLLVVDDIVDSGGTYNKFIELAFQKGIEFITSSIFYKPCSSYKPDVFVSEVPSNLWIVFPWERADEACAVDQTFANLLQEEK